VLGTGSLGPGLGSLVQSPRDSKLLWRSKTALYCTRNRGVEATTVQCTLIAASPKRKQRYSDGNY
jgi:hypothetical protein